MISIIAILLPLLCYVVLVSAVVQQTELASTFLNHCWIATQLAEWNNTTRPVHPVHVVPYSFCSSCSPASPWYNHAGWLGVKHQFTYLYLLPSPCTPFCPPFLYPSSFHILQWSFLLSPVLFGLLCFSYALLCLLVLHFLHNTGLCWAIELCSFITTLAHIPNAVAIQ